MNYLAHGYRFLNDPLFVAGTAVPDWLSVADRKVRARRRLVQPVVEKTTSPHVKTIGRGILQHHADDDVFHRCELFQQLSSELATEFRGGMPDEFDHRPGFLGHIVVELMLDAALAEDDPGLLDQYYATLGEVDSSVIEDVVNGMATRQTQRLAWFIDRFREERFLYDYRDDATLLVRLNQVLRRVKLPVLPASGMETLAFARRLLRRHASDLLATVELQNSLQENDL
ncbi:MAG: hypothetical protein R3C19_25780 [Planctomycetaceae bacterium]